MQNALQTSFWFMIFLQTLGSIDMPGSGDRKMPAPRAYMATMIIWSVLQIVSDSGYDRAARNMSWVIVLASMVVGPFGQRFTDFIGKAADLYGTQDSMTNAQAAAAASAASGTTFTPLSPTFPAQNTPSAQGAATP